MKPALPLMLSAATRVSTSVLSPALRLGSNLPDSRFKVDLRFDVPLVPVNPTFIAILQFMSVVAREEFNEQVHPAIYGTHQHPQVQIATHTWTEARFLLWGIYLAAKDMVNFRRFNNVVVKLFWDNKTAGQIILTVETNLRLPGTDWNGSQSVIGDDGQRGLARIDNGTIQAYVESLNTSLVQNITDSDEVDHTSIVNHVKTGDTALKPLSTSSTLLLPTAVLPPGLTIDFIRVPGATKLTRNGVFLAFYAAILHVAKYPAANDMRAFDSNTPDSDLSVKMFETGFGCLVSLLTPPLLCDVVLIIQD